MTCATGIVILAVAALCVTPSSPTRAQVEGEKPQHRVFVWSPRVEDVALDPTDAQHALLVSIVGHVESITYVVKSGDTIDYLIRTHFFVSIRNQPVAYRIFLEEIGRRNPRLRKDALTPGEKIELPAGPQYSRTALAANSPLAADRNIDPWFVKLSKNGLSSYASSDQLKSKIVANSKHFVAPGTADEVYARLKREGIVPPVDPKVNATDAEREMQTIRTSYVAGENVPKESFAEFLPANESEDVICPGPCTSCDAALNLDGLDLSQVGDIRRSRILVVDSGIDTTIANVSSNHLLYAPNASSDFTDIMPNRHGTFVYSELTNSMRGALLPESVYVAKIAKVDPDDSSNIVYDVGTMGNAVRNYISKLQASNSHSTGTWVVNISAEGPSQDSLIPNPGDRHLLFVAAAGNKNNSTDPESHLFAVEDGPSKRYIIVGATGLDGAKAGYSNWHSTNVDIFAQGSCICGSPGQINGTSQAAPIVATAAALLSVRRPTWDPLEIKWRLISTSDMSQGFEDLAIGGVLNLGRALEAGVEVQYYPAMSADHLLTLNADGVRLNTSALNQLFKPPDTGHMLLRLQRCETTAQSGCAMNFYQLRFDEAKTQINVNLDDTVDLLKGADVVATLTMRQIRSIVLPVRQAWQNGNTITDSP